MTNFKPQMHLFPSRRRFFLLQATFLLLSCSCLTLTTADATWQGLSSDLDSERSEFSDFVENLVSTSIMPAAKTVGLGLTVVRGNSSAPFYSHGFGYRDRDNQLPVDVHTLFPVASITKSVVGVLCVKILSEKFPQYGESVLEMPVGQLLGPNSKLNWTLSDRYRTESISFKDLLAHRAGTSADITSAQYGVVNNPQEYLYRARYEEELFPFRTSWVYNNPMYVLAGLLIADIAGQPFDLLFENLLTELGMTSSRLSKIDEDYANLPNFTQAYYIDENQNVVKGNANLYRQVSVLNPAAGLVSTLSDMNKYISFHMNSGTVDGKEILSKEKHRWLTRIAAPIFPGQSYGLGLELAYIPGEEEPLLSHNGYYPPYTGDISIYPSLGVSIFSASNGPGLIEPIVAAKTLHSEIFAYFLPKKGGKHDTITAKAVKDAYAKMSLDLFRTNPRTVAKITRESKKIQTKTGRFDPSQAVGKFGAPVQGELEIFYKNETEKTLQLKFGVWGQADLVSLPDSNSYKINWTSDIVMHHRSYPEHINILELYTPDLVLLYFTDGSYFEFKRNLTLSDIPEIPWDANSCGVKGKT